MHQENERGLEMSKQKSFYNLPIMQPVFSQQFRPEFPTFVNEAPRLEEAINH